MQEFSSIWSYYSTEAEDLNRQGGKNSAAIKPFFPSVACQCYAAVTMTNDGFETFTHCSYNVLH